MYVNGKNLFLELYDKEEDAAKAYNYAAIKLYGQFANLDVL